ALSSSICEAPGTAESFTLSLHDALPIYVVSQTDLALVVQAMRLRRLGLRASERRQQQACKNRDDRDHDQEFNERECNAAWRSSRSEEHTSELQSPDHLVCRLLLEK